MAEHSYFQLNILVLKITAMYPCRDGANIFERIIDWAYKTFTVISLYFALISPLYEIYLGEKSGITSYSLNIVNACIYVCTALTIHFYQIRGNHMRELITEADNLFKWKSNGLTERDMSENNKLTRKITIAFTSLTTSAVTMMALFPLYSLFTSGEKVLPVPGMYPFDYKESSYYAISYLIQIYAQLIMGALTAAGDSFFMCMALTAAAQFEVLANDFNNCVYNALLEYGLSKESIVDFIETSGNLEESLSEKKSSEKRITRTAVNNSNFITRNNSVLDVINSESFTAKLNELFIGHIKHHQKLLRFCEKMEQFFWPFIFMKTAVNMFYNIFIMFALVTSTNEPLLVLFLLGQYELCALSELFIYSIAGQAIITKSEQLRDTLYFSPWYHCNKKHQVLVHLVLMRSSRAVRISVAKLYDMSHGTFVMILKAAMSYLAVLRQVIDK